MDNKVHNALDGLWSYEKIQLPDGTTERISGYFLFHRGFLIQQAIHDGEPFEQQIAQAHVGEYDQEEDVLRLNAALGILVLPNRSPALLLTRDAQHELTVAHSDNALTLTFGSGTVQTLRWARSGDVRIFRFREGALALMENAFILAATVSFGVVAGSGTFMQKNKSMVLEAIRWFSVLDGNVSYRRNETVRATFDGKRLCFLDGLTLEAV
jgi:hypothetical protein